MNIIRLGPKHLMVQSGDCKLTFNKLNEKFNYQMFVEKSEDMHIRYRNMIGSLDDSYTVLMFTTKLEPNLSFEYKDFEYIVAIHEECEDILIKFVQYKEEIKIQNLRSSPKWIIMRMTGDYKKYINSVNKDINGEIIPIEDIFEKYSKGTMIVFTEKNIQGALEDKDFNNQIVYSKKRSTILMKHLNNNTVRYINASIDNKNWSELIIKIYDMYGRYSLQYERLMLILKELDCGLILGESWGKDAALVFRSVDVYQIRLFTYLAPIEIKKITLALEYGEDEERVVDLDIYMKRKKYSWSDIKAENTKGRDPLGAYYRKKLVSELTEEIKVELLLIEKEMEKAK
jgi:hypothetical protein